MSLTKANQKPHRELKEAVTILKWFGMDLMQVAERLSKVCQEDEASELLKIAAGYQAVDNELQNQDR